MPIKAGSANPSDLIKQVITEIDSQIKELADQRAQLAKMVSGAVAAAPAAKARRRGRPPAAVAAPAGKKRKVSPETKRKLRAAAKARWARHRAEQKSAAA